MKIDLLAERTRLKEERGIWIVIVVPVVLALIVAWPLLFQPSIEAGRIQSVHDELQKAMHDNNVERAVSLFVPERQELTRKELVRLRDSIVSASYLSRDYTKLELTVLPGLEPRRLDRSEKVLMKYIFPRAPTTDGRRITGWADPDIKSIAFQKINGKWFIVEWVLRVE